MLRADVTYDGLDHYLYDPNSVRIAKGTITSMSCDPTPNGFQITENYVLGPGGEELAMIDGNNNWQRTKPGSPPLGFRRRGGPNVYAGSKLIGTYDSAGPHFHIEDLLPGPRGQVFVRGAGAPPAACR